MDYPATELAIDPNRTIAILPTAAIEQHGPHLPVGVDSYIGQGLADLLAERCPEHLDIRLLPVQCVGKSNEHLWATGTVTLSAETALKAWTEIGCRLPGRACARCSSSIPMVGTRTSSPSLAGSCASARACIASRWAGVGLNAPGLYSEQEAAQGIHGGDNETSLMLHLRPETVDMSKAEDFRWIHEQGEISPLVGSLTVGSRQT